VPYFTNWDRYWSLIYQCICPFFHTSHWLPVINIAHCLPCSLLVLKKTQQAVTLFLTINIQDNRSYTCSLHSISTGPALIFDYQTLVVVLAALALSAVGWYDCDILDFRHLTNKIHAFENNFKLESRIYEGYRIGLIMHIFYCVFVDRCVLEVPYKIIWT